MTQLQFLNDWVADAAPVAFWTCLLWPALVRLIWPWNRHQWGWNMIIKTELIALALLGTVLHREFGVTNPYVLLWTVALAVTAIPLVVGWRTWIIWRGQRDGALRDRQLRCYFVSDGPRETGALFAFPGTREILSPSWTQGFTHGLGLQEDLRRTARSPAARSVGEQVPCGRASRVSAGNA